MLLQDDILMLLRQKQWNPDFLLKYAKLANSLQYQSTETILETAEFLKNGIQKYARQHSPLYKRRRTIIDKSQLLDSNRWFVGGLDSFDNATNGSTAHNFKYQIWRDAYEIIERECHYAAIVEEFQIKPDANILYLGLDYLTDRIYDTLIITCSTPSIVFSHGLRMRAKVHVALINQTYLTNYHKYYESLLRYIDDHDFDIISASGPIIACLRWNIQRLGYKGHLGKLLSSTGEKLDVDDVEFLQRHGHIDHWCDHMRCWDGGVTFFTCRYNTYHLLDGLAWAYSDKQYRLVSYDYFSLPSPFVNYWNGDYAEISDEYQRCRCGRAYREFRIGRTRDFTTYGTFESNKIVSGLSEYGGNIRRMLSYKFHMRIFTKIPFSIQERSEIRKLLLRYTVNFVTEEDFNG